MPGELVVRYRPASELSCLHVSIQHTKITGRGRLIVGVHGAVGHGPLAGELRDAPESDESYR